MGVPALAEKACRGGDDRVPVFRDALNSEDFG